jgi:hypothetical protein
LLKINSLQNFSVLRNYVLPYDGFLTVLMDAKSRITKFDLYGGIADHPEWRALKGRPLNRRQADTPATPAWADRCTRHKPS